MAAEVNEDGQGVMNKERLAKLWNAYEIQEKEMGQMKARIEDYEKAIQEKDSMIGTLKEAMSARDKEIRDLEIQLSKLEKEHSGCEPKIKEADKDLKIEKERFAKLYSLAEELEADIKELRESLDDRDRWFKSNIDILRGFSRALSEREEIIDREAAGKKAAAKK